MNTTSQNHQPIQPIHAAIIGCAVGDALGVPVEFMGREIIRDNPVTDMRGFGTHNQEPGTWSDDTSLTLCLAESLCDGFDLADQGQRFIRWHDEQYWTPRGAVFDIGNTTMHAISMLRRGIEPRLAGPRDQYNNGNGSLMRISPLAVYFAHDDQQARINAAMDASCLTHGHIRSQIACAFYVELGAALVRGERFNKALAATRSTFAKLIEHQFPDEWLSFMRILDDGLPSCNEDEVIGSGYVIDCLHASLWCCATTASFEEAVLKAVNLGRDTDTTGAVTGALAGLMYGIDAVPDHWRYRIARHDDIDSLCDRLTTKCESRWAVNHAANEENE